MHYEADRDNQYLMHYGVPGQKWGVITKEYQPVAFDKRKQKHVQSQAVKIRQQQQRQASYQSFYNRGKSLGDNYFFRKARERHMPQEPEREKKPDLVDKAVKKAADHFGVGAYSKLASNWLKKQAKNTAIDYVMKHKNQTIKIGGKALGTILSKTLGPAGRGVAYLMGKSGAILKTSAKLTGRGAKFIAKVTGKVGMRSIDWLTKKGGAKKIAIGSKRLAQMLRSGIHALVNYTRLGTSEGGRIARTGKQAGSRIAIAGARKLTELLRRRRR